MSVLELLIKMKKGQASYILPLFTLLLTGVLAGALAFLTPAEFTKITPTIEEREFENKAIILSRSLSSSQALIYNDSQTSYSKLFDKGKLDSNLIEKSTLSSNNLFSCNHLCQTTKSLPLSFSFIVISDLEEDRGWFSILNAPVSNPTTPEEQSFLNKIDQCLQNIRQNFNNEIKRKIFSENNLYELLELEQCGFESASIIDNGVSVSIRYSDDDTNMGLLRVLVIE